MAEEDIIEQLIEKVRMYPYLYDTSHQFYKNVVKKAEAWQVIAEELNITSDTAKTKWKSLRDNYMRHKKSVKGVTGQAKKYQKWPWSEQMQFLDDTLRTRPTDSNIPSNEVEDSTLLDNETPNPQNEGAGYETQADPGSSEMPPPPPPKKKKVGSTAQHDTPQNLAVHTVLDYLQNRPARREFDGIDHLFLSYADTFRKFQPATQAMMKMELATLFARMEIRELGTPFFPPGLSTSQSTLHSYNHSSCSSADFSPLGPENTSSLHQSMSPMSSSTNDSYESARHVYEQYGSNFLSD